MAEGGAGKTEGLNRAEKGKIKPGSEQRHPFRVTQDWGRRDGGEKGSSWNQYKLTNDRPSREETTPRRKVLRKKKKVPTRTNR